MNLTLFDEAAAGSKQHGGKKIVIKKSQVTQFLMHMKAAV